MLDPPISPPTRCLIVGAGGFLGSHCSARAETRGWTVERWRSSADDSSGWFSRIREGAFDVVINAAARTFRQPESDLFSDYWAANVDLPARLAQATAAVNTTFVHVSTHWAGMAQGERALSMYSATKALGETIVAGTRGPGTPARRRCHVVRVRDLFGPGDQRRNVLRVLSDDYQAGIRPDMTSGWQLIDPLDVRDVSDAILRLAEVSAAHPTTPVVTELALEPMSVRQLVALWNRVSGDNCRPNWGALPDRGTEIYSMPRNCPPLVFFTAREREITLRDVAQDLSARRDEVARSPLPASVRLGGRRANHDQ